MDIGTIFHKKQEIKRKIQFDENPDDTNIATQSAEESSESIILYLLLIKQFSHSQGDLNNMRVTRKYLVFYLPLKYYSHWIIRV